MKVQIVGSHPEEIVRMFVELNLMRKNSEIEQVDFVYRAPF